MAKIIKTKRTKDNCEINLESHRRYYADGKLWKFWTWFGDVCYINVVSHEIGARAEYSFPPVLTRPLFSRREMSDIYDKINSFQEARNWDAFLRKKARERE